MNIRITNRPSPAQVARIDNGTIPILARMQSRGICVDIDRLHDLSSFLATECARVTAQAESVCGTHINLGSHPQVRQLLFKKLRVQDALSRKLKLTKKTGLEATGKLEIEPYINVHPVVPLILEFREYQKLLGTYVNAFIEIARPCADGAHRIYQTIKPYTAATGRLAGEEPNCYSGDTEVLTDIGWVRFDQLEPILPRIRIAQWHKDSSVDFVHTTQFIARAATDCVHIHNQHIDLNVTPDHRVLARNRKRNRLLEYAAAVFPKDAHILHGGFWKGGCGLQLTDDELRLLVALQADGWYEGTGATGFAFTKTRKVERLHGLLKRLKLLHSHKQRQGRHRFYVKNCAVVQRIRSFLGPCKQFGAWLLDMSPQQAALFADEIMYWNGCSTSRRQWASSVKSNADWVQIVFVLLGKRANVRQYRPKNPNAVISWQVDMTPRVYSGTANIKMTPSASADVYCIGVPSTWIIVRRNGKTAVCGNCMNIPVRGTLGKLFKACFVPSPGHRLFACDFSQIEMRVAAHAAGARRMSQVFWAGGDIHTETAVNVYKLPAEQIHPQKHRYPMKRTGFGVLYLITGQGLAVQLNARESQDPDYPHFWEDTECDELIEGWYSANSEIRDWQQDVFAFARRHEMVSTMFGRIRRVPEVRSAHSWIQDKGLRQAANHPVQGGAADLFKLALARLGVLYEDLRSAGTKVEALVPIHDDVLGECQEDWAEDVAKLTKEVMEDGPRLDVPVVAEPSVGDAGAGWAELKKLKDAA